MHAIRWSRLAPVLYLFVGLLLVDLLVHWQRERWKRYDPDEYLARVEACREQRPDVVFVGGSPVSESLDPVCFAGLSWNDQPAQSVFNLGLPGGTTTDVYHVVQRAFPTPPRLLVYGISATDLNDSRNEPHGAQVLVTWNDYAEHIQTRPEQTEWLTRQMFKSRRDRLWQLYRYRNGIRLWCWHQLETNDEVTRGLQDSEAYRQKNGFAPRPELRELNWEQLHADGWDGGPFFYLDRYAIGGHLRYLDKLAQWCRDRNVTLVLVDMPVSDELRTRRNPGEFALYRRELEAFVQREQVPFIDASANTGLTDADFADLIHLNKHGSRKFAEWLKLQLEARR